MNPLLTEKRNQSGYLIECRQCGARSFTWLHERTHDPCDCWPQDGIQNFRYANEERWRGARLDVVANDPALI